MYKERLPQRIIRLAETFPVTVVMAPGRSARPPCCSICFPATITWCARTRASTWKTPARTRPLLRNHPPPVILDEIQYAPEVVAAVKRHVDRAGAGARAVPAHRPQQWQVLRTLSESLAGRAAFLDLQGLSLQERAGAATGWLTRWLEEPTGFSSGAARPTMAMTI